MEMNGEQELILFICLQVKGNKGRGDSQERARRVKQACSNQQSLTTVTTEEAQRGG